MMQWEESGHPWKKELIEFCRWMIFGLLGEGRCQGDFKATVLNNGAGGAREDLGTELGGDQELSFRYVILEMLCRRKCQVSSESKRDVGGETFKSCHIQMVYTKVYTEMRKGPRLSPGTFLH